MKKLMICSMMCLTVLAAKAQVLTSVTVNKVYENAVKESGDGFAYETERNGNDNITTMYVYQKKTRGKGAVDLKPVCRYQYVYAANGLLSSCTKSVWRKGGWQLFGRHAYMLTEESIACYSRQGKNGSLELEWQMVTECQPINMAMLHS